MNPARLITRFKETLRVEAQQAAAINGAPASKLKLQVNLHHMKFKMPFLLQHVDNSEH